jgi:hypothetical protein
LRFTSQNRVLIDQIADLYHGTVSQWESPRGPEWQVYIEDEEIDIIVPPSEQAVTTSYELWSAAGMQRYCDGETAKIPGSDEKHSCICDSQSPNETRACTIKARMNVWLPKVQTLGVWRLETGSWYAAGELTGMVDMLLRASKMLEHAVTAKLRLDRRVIKRDGQTFRFNVPIITPVGDVAHILTAATPANQIGQARPVQERPALPEVVTPPDTEEWPESEEPLELSAPQQSYGSMDKTSLHKTGIVIACREAGMDDDERHEFILQQTGNRTQSTKELYELEMHQIWSALKSRMTNMTVQLMNKIWSTPEEAYATVKEQCPEVKQDVNQWTFRDWSDAYKYCKTAVTPVSQQH